MRVIEGDETETMVTGYEYDADDYGWGGCSVTVPQIASVHDLLCHD